MDDLEKIIDDLERQYRPFGSSERFHEETKLRKKSKAPPYEEWPESWRIIDFKGYPRLPQIPLTKVFSKLIKNPLDEVLHQRESVRQYHKKRISKRVLSTLLFYSAGIRVNKGSDWSTSRRFYPSGGARYPLELYLVLYNNTEIPHGIYHYNVKRHTLEVLKKGIFLKDLKSGLEPEWLEQGNLALLITAVFGRNQIKYGERGYRHILIEAGHLGQNIYLCSAALGLGCCALGGYVDDVFIALLDIDGTHESIIYSFIVGYPNKRSNG